MGDFSINHTLCLRLWGYGGRPLHPAAIGIGNLYVTDADGDGAPGATTQVLCLGTPVLGKMGRQKRPDSSLREVGTHPEHSIYMPQHAEIKRVNTEQKLPQPHFHPRIIWKRRKNYDYLAERFILPVNQSVNRDFRHGAGADESTFTVSGLRAIKVTDSHVHPALAAVLSQYKESNQVLSKLLGQYLLFMDYASDSVSPLSFYTVDYLCRDMQYTQIPYKINQSLTAEKKERCVGILEDCRDAVEVELYAREYVLPGVVVVVRK